MVGNPNSEHVRRRSSGPQRMEARTFRSMGKDAVDQGGPGHHPKRGAAAAEALLHHAIIR